MLLKTSTLVTLAEKENMLTAEIRTPFSSLCGGRERTSEHPQSINMAQCPQDKRQRVQTYFLLSTERL